MNIYSDQKYVVYHTTYSGDKFPANYIGSTSQTKIQQGYKGSVSSKEYKQIWNEEVKTNSHLFSVHIISYHDTRSEATYKELQIQKIFNVVTNPLFINKSYAQPNGFFGMDNCKEKNPNYNKPITNETKFKLSETHKGQIPWNKGLITGISPWNKGLITGISPWNKGKVGVQTAWNKGLSASEETKFKLSETRKGQIPWNKGKIGVQTAWNKGIPSSSKGIPKPKITCPHCNKIGGASSMKRWHFDKCKFKSHQ
jgi:hypothetical protein